MQSQPFLLFILLLCHTESIGQPNISGKYEDAFGASIDLKSDSTLRYDYRFDLMHFWTVGQWHVRGRRIDLTFMPIYDTLSRSNQPDSLVLSVDETTEKIDDVEFATNSLLSGGQSIDRMPGQVIAKRDRLYLVSKSGKPDRRRVRGFWTRKRWPTWYRKV